ncbi:hypothetical protein C8J57DRAFT_1230617 [Mycena rebaudengoi]|nr:hypothetical protein C8J57DRAFT_1230617 [Mycena rebaudengoi]
MGLGRQKELRVQKRRVRVAKGTKEWAKGLRVQKNGLEQQKRFKSKKAVREEVRVAKRVQKKGDWHPHYSGYLHGKRQQFTGPQQDEGVLINMINSEPCREAGPTEIIRKWLRQFGCGENMAEWDFPSDQILKEVNATSQQTHPKAPNIRFPCASDKDGQASAAINSGAIQRVEPHAREILIEWSECDPGPLTERTLANVRSVMRTGEAKNGRPDPNADALGRCRGSLQAISVLAHVENVILIIVTRDGLARWLLMLESGCTLVDRTATHTPRIDPGLGRATKISFL